MNSSHLKFINEAHNIASKKFGTTFPNPVVGCVIAKKNQIISLINCFISSLIEGSLKAREMVA